MRRKEQKSSLDASATDDQQNENNGHTEQQNFQSALNG
jgi:hypothetical protein